MNSKEQLEQFINKNNLLKLKELEKENQSNKDLIKIQNEIIKIKEDENIKLKKVIDILKSKIEFEDLGEMQSGNMYRGYFNDCLDEEEVKSVKEVFENDK